MNMLKTKSFFTNILHKIYNRLQSKLDLKPKISEEEKICQNICIKLIQTEQTKLTIAPISGKRFIKNDEKEMFIVIHQRVISLINHVYSYNVYIENDSIYKKIIDEFDKELEDTREVLEQEIKSNIKHSLTEILKNLN
jgi:hypothetical protein